MEIPESAADIDRKVIGDANAYIINPYQGKGNFTTKEAIDCINRLSGVLLADECYKSKKEHKKYL